VVGTGCIKPDLSPSLAQSTFHKGNAQYALSFRLAPLAVQIQASTAAALATRNVRVNTREVLDHNRSAAASTGQRRQFPLQAKAPPPPQRARGHCRHERRREQQSGHCSYSRLGSPGIVANSATPT
jgi:hypothetical protein